MHANDDGDEGGGGGGNDGKFMAVNPHYGSPEARNTQQNPMFNAVAAAVEGQGTIPMACFPCFWLVLI